MMRFTTVALSVCLVLNATEVVMGDYVQGFETDTAGWDVFGGGFDALRVASGTNGVSSASGSWHAEGGTPATNWGGYSSTFVPWMTSLQIYLDVDAALSNDTRFDFSSAATNSSGDHLRDYVFNGGFYDSGDNTGPGAGTNRFIFSASNNSGRANSFPKNPARNPVAATTTGWYTFKHNFYENGLGNLEAELTLSDPSDSLVGSWILTDLTDDVATTAGGNRYGWFVNNELPFIAFDNTTLNAIPEPSAFLFGALVCAIAGWHRYGRNRASDA